MLILKRNLLPPFPAVLTKNISYFYPDLNQDESEFVKTQVQLSLKDYSEKSTEEIFPPKSRKYLVPTVGLVQKFYPDFCIPKQGNERYMRNLPSMPKLERTLFALKWAKVSKEELIQNPDLILMQPSEIANLSKIAKSANIKLSEVSSYTQSQNLNGLFVRNHIKSTLLTLKILDFVKVSKKIQEVDFASESPLRYSRLEYIMSKILMQAMCRSIPDLNQVVIDSQVFPQSTVDLARIFHLWFTLKQPKFNIKSLQKINAMEMMIQINVLNQALDVSLDELDPECLWQYLQNASLKFPLSIQIAYLSQIGFTKEEIKNLILTPKPQRLSSKSLPFTSADYIPAMKHQLEIIRQANPALKEDELMKSLTNHQFSKDTKLKNEIKINASF